MSEIQYNCCLVISVDGRRILLCRRQKDPFRGKLNLVGGKREPGESPLEAAYRELYEETGIDKDIIELIHLMDMDYPFLGYSLEIFYGNLLEEPVLREELNPLEWVSTEDDFTDTARFAGAANIQHIVNITKMYEKELLEWKAKRSLREL